MSEDSDGPPGLVDSSSEERWQQQCSAAGRLVESSSPSEDDEDEQQTSDWLRQWRMQWSDEISYRVQMMRVRAAESSCRAAESSCNRSSGEQLQMMRPHSAESSGEQMQIMLPPFCTPCQVPTDTDLFYSFKPARRELKQIRGLLLKKKGKEELKEKRKQWKKSKKKSRARRQEDGQTREIEKATGSDEQVAKARNTSRSQWEHLRRQYPELYTSRSIRVWQDPSAFPDSVISAWHQEDEERKRTQQIQEQEQHVQQAADEQAAGAELQQAEQEQETQLTW